MHPRRSPRLANKDINANKAKNTSICLQDTLHHNLGCMLSNASRAGCCYNQDIRKKFSSGNKNLRDSIADIPLGVRSTEYIDGIGDSIKYIPCYTRYCPACKNYWAARVQNEQKEEEIPWFMM